MTPYECTGSKEERAIELLDQDGNLVNSIASSECFAGWLCLNYAEFGMYPEVSSMTYRIRVDDIRPEDEPPIDEPEDPAP